MLQRKEGKPGKGLGKTTGWIHRLTLRQRGVQAIPGVTYKAIEPGGLRIEVGGKEQFLAVDHVVFCSGQLSNNEAVATPNPQGFQSKSSGARSLTGRRGARHP